MIEAHVLFSGSRGNAILVRDGTTAILVDAGKSRRAIGQALFSVGVSLADLAAVFVTHEHIDHTAALEQLAKCEGLPLHAAAGTAEWLTCGRYTPAVLRPHPPIFTETVGVLTVQSIPLPHDSRCHVGYRITSADGDAILLATDLGHIPDSLPPHFAGCRAALLEANHDPDMLRTGPYPAALKARILSPTGHLSNGDCAALARLAADAGVTEITLGHLSEENNTPALARKSVGRALDGSGACTLSVASQCETVRLA